MKQERIDPVSQNKGHDWKQTFGVTCKDDTVLYNEAMIGLPRFPSLRPWSVTRRALNASNVFRPVVAFVLLLGGCGGGAPTTLELVPRTGEDLPVDELAQAVAERIDPADFVEQHDVDTLVMQVRDGLLFVRGVVNTGSDGAMIELLNRSPDVRTVVLTLVPGSANDEVNVALGRKLRSAGMTMYLPARGMVASGGTDLLISGSRRIVEPGARVGVHSWASIWRSGNEIPRDDPRHAVYLDYYRAMEMPEAFYWFTLDAASPEDVYWMTEAEIARYRISTVPR